MKRNLATDNPRNLALQHQQQQNSFHLVKSILMAKPAVKQNYPAIFAHLNAGHHKLRQP